MKGHSFSVHVLYSKQVHRISNVHTWGSDNPILNVTVFNRMFKA